MSESETRWMRKFAFCAGRHRFFWLRYRLLHLGWSGLIWFSGRQSRCQPDAWLMGILDAGVHAVPHRSLSVDGTDLVQRVRQSGSFIHGGPCVHGLRHSLVRDVLPAIYRFQRPAGRLDGDSLPVSSILGVDVFRRAGDIPVMLIFVGLTLIYVIEIPTRLLSWTPGGRLVGL